MKDKTTLKCETCGSTIHLDATKEERPEPNDSLNKTSIGTRIIMLIGSLFAFWVVYTISFHIGRVLDIGWVHATNWPISGMLRSGVIVISLAALLNARKIVIFTLLGFIGSVALAGTVNMVRFSEDIGAYRDFTPQFLPTAFTIFVFVGIILETALWGIREYKKDSKAARAETHENDLK